MKLLQVCKHSTPAASLLTLPIRQPSRHDMMHRPVSTFVPAPAPVHIKLKVEGAPSWPPVCSSCCTCRGLAGRPIYAGPL